jgi:ubiquinone/menaquinone biosynthesis C-methylase UbiE
MAESFSSKLRLWEGWNPPVAQGLSPPAGLLPPRCDANGAADRHFFEETLHRHRPDLDGAEPYSLQWFLTIEAVRHNRQGRWIPHLLEFGKHPGEKLLGLGRGLGTDWVQYARRGAEVTACCPSTEHLALVQRNFELRGLPGRFLHADPAAIPLAASSIDVVCVSHLLDELSDPAAAIEEIYRVLKPGGKVLAVAPARYDVDYWCRRLLPWERLLKDNRSSPHGFSARRLRRLFGRFVEHRIHKRHLRRAEVPHLWRWLPLSLLERLFGHFLVLKAFKPLSAAIPTPLAAA